MSVRLRIVLAVFALVAAVVPAGAATPEVRPLRTEGRFEHAGLDTVLMRIVHGNLVDYARLAENRAPLDRYLARVAGARSAQLPTRADSLAFFINAYNAITLGLVADHYPGIRNVNEFKIDGKGFFRTPVLVADSLRTLDDLEHRILRPRFREPRTHFAVNCASLSCPPLAPRAYTAANLERQLERATRAFLNDTMRNRFDRAAGVLRVSKLFEWFAEDFVTHSGSVAAFVAPYLADPAERRRTLAPTTKVEYLDYDWRLNDFGPGASSR